MSKIEQKNRARERDEDYDFEEASYVLPPQGPAADISRSHPEADEDLGDIRQPEVYETEHHVYSGPFRYKNVQLRYWSENSPKGHEFLADLGSITIVEEQPIVDDLPAITESDILGPSEAFREKMDYFSHANNARAMLERLASTNPATLACMHDSDMERRWAGTASGSPVHYARDQPIVQHQRLAQSTAMSQAEAPQERRT